MSKITIKVFKGLKGEGDYTLDTKKKTVTSMGFIWGYKTWDLSDVSFHEISSDRAQNLVKSAAVGLGVGLVSGGLGLLAGGLHALKKTTLFEARKGDEIMFVGSCPQKKFLKI